MPSPDESEILPSIAGKGKVDEKELDRLRENWGKLPEKDRAKAMTGLVRNLPPKYAIIIENWEKSLGRAEK